MKKHSRRQGRISRWFSRWGKGTPRPKLHRHHRVEALEGRELLAADVNLLAMSPLSAEGEPGDLVSIMPEIQSNAATVNVGGTYNVRVLIQDLRPDDPNTSNSAEDRGVFSAVTDLTFNPELSGIPLASFLTANDASSFFGPTYANIDLALLDQRVGEGKIRINSPLANLQSPPGEDELLFATIPFKAGAVADFTSTNEDTAVTIDVLGNDTSASGTQTIATTFVNAQGQTVLLFVESDANENRGNLGVAEEDIMFASDSVQVSVPGAPTLTGVGTAANGTTQIVNGQVRYTPAANFFGTDTFTYTVTYPGAVSDTATVTVRVNNTNDAPNAVNDTFTVNKSTVLEAASPNLLTNDTDPDTGAPANDQIRVTQMAAASQRGVTIAPIVRTSGTAQSGSTSTTIKLAADASSTNDEYNGNLLVITSGTGAGQRALITDYSGSSKTATISPNWTTTPDATSQYQVIVNGGFRYDPTGVAAFQSLQPGQTLTDTFTYTISDRAGLTDTATATVTVTGSQVATTVDKVKFAQDLTAAGVKFYGAVWCPFCTEQKQLFEDGAEFLPFIEVTNPDRSINQVGQQNNIDTFPTWVFPDGTREERVLTLQEISTLSGVALPMGDAPFLAPIENVTLLAGAPLHIPLDGYDPNGTKLTYTVQVAGNSGVSAQVLGQTRSLRVNMQGYEDMVIRLFDNEVPRVTNAIAQLAQDNEYDNVIFHRAVPGFVIQGGDPTGTGMGDPSLPRFDDQFHFDLQHTSKGVVSMAKAGDDTNGSQFFMTEVATRSLDFNHSVFGFLVEGDHVREAISKLPNSGSPSNTIQPSLAPKMTSVDVFMDEENGLLRLKAAAGATGTATVTVTATDADGKTATRTFNVTVQADTSNGAPFLADIPQVTTTPNTPVSFQLPGRDVEGDTLIYAASIPSGSTPTFQFNVNQSTGQVTVTPPQDFVGTLELMASVRQSTNSNTGDQFDTQLVTIQVKPGAPTAIDLLAGSDTGALSDDNITNATQLQFQVNGVRSGATVQLFRGTQLVGSATVPAGATTVTVTTNNPTLLTEGVHQFTARQTVDGAQSDASPALAVTIDRTAPPAFTSTAPTAAFATNQLVYDAQNPLETSGGVFYSLVNPPTGASINQTTGVLTWTPAASQVGTQNFSIRARDAAGNTVDQALSLDVTLGATRGDTYTVNEDTTLTVTGANDVLNNDDPDNTLGSGALTATKVTDPQNGTLTFNADGTFTYTPNANFQGTDFFTYRASRGSQQGNVGTVTINVLNVFDPPVAANDTYTATEDTVLQVNQANGVQKNDQNPDNATLNSVVVAQPTKGQVVLNANGSFVYTPNANANGQDTFTYRLNPGSQQSNVATVTINITAVNDPPVAVNDTFTTPEDTPLVVTAANNILLNDTDSDSTSLIFLVVSQPQHGTLTAVNGQAGTFTYTPAPNFFGTDTFTYRASDNNSQSANLATVTINVTGANDPPVVQAITLTSFKNAPRTFIPITSFSNRITDPDGAATQTFTVTAVSNPSQQGVVEVGTQNGVSGFFYTPRANFTGAETIQITIADQGGATGTGTATINVREFRPGSIAGFVYLDHNLDGVLQQTEGRVAGITITLTGTLTNGTAVPQRTTTTGVDGSYKFDDLQPGTYTIAQTQPSLLVDGKDTVGSQGGENPTNDQFRITVAEGVDGTGNNFAELRPASTFSMVDFFYVKPVELANSVLVNAGTSGAREYFIIESGWPGVANFDAVLNTNRTSATLNLEETDGDDFRAENVTQFQSLTSNTTRSLIRVSGTRSSLNFQPVTSSSSTNSTASATSDTSDTSDTNSTNPPSTQDEGNNNQAEGEADSAAPFSSQFVASGHEFSINDFLYTANVSAATSTETSRGDERLQLPEAVDTVLTELAEGEDAAPVHDLATASLTEEEDFLDAVDLVFQEDAAASV